MEPAQQTHPTNFETYIVEALSSMTRRSSTIDQDALRQCLGLSSSYLVSDTTMNPTGGIISWSAGLNRLVDVLTALHSRGELELETVNAASKACSECWTVAGNWTGLGEGKESVKRVAVRLKELLDENGRTFGGERVYVP
ncbi:hypothetical protein DFH94DRAFT_238421 [Russula ochroleuca]|uniref:Uncharacterized protein n=1 Tax=Russula ochroleuca TaxID=152965 RepID=A0A9P5TCI5_9AGAM|nr:hypothetical protein DFH94DRAFT_238421 [Russula ochroleuca]